MGRVILRCYLGTSWDWPCQAPWRCSCSSWRCQIRFGRRWSKSPRRCRRTRGLQWAAVGHWNHGWSAGHAGRWSKKDIRPLPGMAGPSSPTRVWGLDRGCRKFLQLTWFGMLKKSAFNVFAACHLSAFVAQTQNEDCHELHNELTVLTCAECVVIYFSPEGADADVANAPSALDLGQCLNQLAGSLGFGPGVKWSTFCQARCQREWTITEPGQLLGRASWPSSGIWGENADVVGAAFNALLAIVRQR